MATVLSDGALGGLDPAELLDHADWVKRVAARLVRDAGDADDLAQDAMEAALVRGPVRDGPVRPWLGGVVRNLWRSRSRSDGRRAAREVAAEPPAAELSPEQLTLRVEAQQLVARAVLELRPTLREVVLLRYYAGNNSTQIGERLGLSAAAVRTRLATALTELRACLDASDRGADKQWAIALGVIGPAAEATANAAKTAALGSTKGAAHTAAAVGVTAMKAKTIAIAVAGLALLLFVGWWGGGKLGLFGGDDGDKSGEPVATSDDTPKKRVLGKSTPRASALLEHSAAMLRSDDPIGKLRLEGQVIDGEERPVGGAIVAIDSNPPRTVTAEGDGSFAFDKLIGRTYLIEATSSEGYAGPVSLRMSRKAEPVILRVRPAGKIEVTVTDDAGAPVAGAAVELRSALRYAATTDDKGVAALDGVGRGSLSLRVSADGFAPHIGRVAASGFSGEPQREQVTLSRGAAVSGKVVSADGKPVAGARVVAVSTSEPFPVFDIRRDGVAAGEDGTFTLAAVAAGTHRLEARHRDFAPAATPPITISGSANTTGIEITLAAGGRVSGTVKDDRGKAVAGADVRLVSRGSVPWRSSWQAFTDKRGQFEFTGLPRRDADVVASTSAASSAVAVAKLSEQPEASVELALAVSGTIAGTVVDEQGEALAEAQVYAEPEWDGSTEQRAAWAVRGVQFRISDGGGKFDFGGLPDGSYRLRAARPGAQMSTILLDRGQVVATGATGVTLTAPSSGSIRGRVLYKDGSPAGVFTIAVGSTRPVPFSPKDGVFELDAPGGTHNVVVSGPTFVRTTVEATVSGAEPSDLGTISVEKGRSISGQVLDAAGDPVPGAEVAVGKLLTGDGANLYIDDESIAAKATTADEDGRFVFKGQRPGRLTIVAGMKGKGRSDSISIPPGEHSVDLDLVLEPTGTLAGVITKDGKPLAETVVIAKPAGALSSNFFVVTGADGSYALDSLAVADYVVFPMIGGGGSRPKDMYVRPIRIEAGARAKLNIDITTGSGSMTVTGKTDAGAEVGAAQVMVLGLAISAGSLAELAFDQWWSRLAGLDEPLPFFMRNAMGESATVEGLRPGTYSACVVPLPIDPNNPSAARRLRERMDELPMKCETVEIADSQSPTPVTVVVPAAWLEPPE